jgi:hypothetical protein
MSQPISFRWDPEFIASLDAARGAIPRSTFVRACVEAIVSATPGPSINPAAAQVSPRVPVAESAVEEGRRLARLSLHRSSSDARAGVRPNPKGG